MRAITRHTSSVKAQELARQGAEVVEADLDDPASVRRVMKGAYCVTFFWEYFSSEKKLAEARTLAEAAKAEGVQHVIWSTLEDSSRQWVPPSDDRMPTLMGKYKVPHLDAKGEANRFFTDLGVPVAYHAVEPAVYRSFGLPGADDLGNMFQFQRDFADDSLKARSVEFSRQLNPALQSFGTWLVAHAKQIPMEMAAA